MKKRIGIIIGIIVAVAVIILSVVLFAPDKDTEVNNPSENISQNDVSEQEKTESTVMKETIDLFSVDLTEYGLTKDIEISVPYPTMLGCAYVVRDYGKAEEQTYLFVTTKDKVMYLNTGFPSAGKMPLTGEYSYGTYSLQIGDLDGEKGEEIVFLSNTGGNGGAGIYCNGIYKISNGKITAMEINNEEPFTVSLEAPYTVVFKNEKLDYEERIVCDSDYESLFDDNGNPEVDEYDGGFYAPHEVEVYLYDEEQQCVCFTSYSYLSRSMNDKEVYSTVNYIYDAKTNQFVIAEVGVSVQDPVTYPNDVFESEEEYLETLTYTNGYTYYDINKDGIDEFITHVGTCEADRVYRVFTFKDGKMYCAGEINAWHANMYEKNNAVVVTSSAGTSEGWFVQAVTYELVDNKLVEKETFEKEYTDETESDYISDLDETGKEIKINNIYYR